MGCKIMVCTCKNEYQDKKYGKQQRVFNEAIKGWRCTVCEKVVPK